MKQLTIVILALLNLYQCSSLQTKAPFMEAESVQNLSSDFEIDLVDFGFYRKINGDWWGEDFYVSTFEIRNKSNQYKHYRICPEKLEERNFNYTINRNQTLQQIYSISPEKVDKAGFLKGYPQMKLIVEILNTNHWPTATYNKKEVFPKLVNSKSEFVAAMTACSYGIPMSRDTDRASTSTGWIAPGEKGSIKTIFSIPNGATILRFEQDKYFKANLKLLERKD